MQSEDYITKLNFATLTIYRPGLLDRGDSARKVEKFACKQYSSATPLEISF
jgi:hypothetical protein